MQERRRKPALTRMAALVVAGSLAAMAGTGRAVGESGLKGLYVGAQACVAAGDFAGALALLDDVTLDAGPRRVLVCPGGVGCLSVPDPSDDSSFFCVGGRWAGRFEPAAIDKGLSVHMLFPDSLRKILGDLQVDLRPRSAAVCGKKLVVNFFSQGEREGRRYGLFAGISTSTLGVDWVYEPDDVCETWAAGDRVLAMTSEESHAVSGLSLTNGVVIWENSEVHANWTAMAACSNVLAAGGSGTVAAFDEDTGRLLWKAAAQVDSICGAGDRFIVASRVEGVSVFHAGTGERLWRQPAEPADVLPVLSVRGDTVTAVQGNMVRFLDIGTGAVRSTLNIPRDSEVLAVAAGSELICLRTPAGYVCLDPSGAVLHRSAFHEDRFGRPGFRGPDGLLLWRDRLVIDTSCGRLLNVADPVTTDDLLELRAACRMILKAGADPDWPIPGQGRGFGALLPAVLRAEAGDDQVRLHALYMAHMHRALPCARTEMMNALRKDAGLRYMAPGTAYEALVSGAEYALTRSLPGRVDFFDWRSGERLYSVPHEARFGSPVLTHGGDHMMAVDDAAGVAACWEVRTGRLLWETDLYGQPATPPDAPADGETPDPSDPAPDHDAVEAVIVECGADMQRVAVRADDGRLLWSGRSDLDRRFLRGAYVRRVSGVFLEARHGLRRRSAPVPLVGTDVLSGRRRWVHNLPADVRLGGVNSDHILLVGGPRNSSDSGEQRSVSVMEIETGREVWSQSPPGGWTVLLRGNYLVQTSWDGERIPVKIIELPAGTVVMDSSFAADEVSAGHVRVSGGMAFVTTPVQDEGRPDLIRRCGTVRVFDLRAHRELGRIAGPPDIVMAKDDILACSDSATGSIWVFDLKRALAPVTPIPHERVGRPVEEVGDP